MIGEGADDCPHRPLAQRFQFADLILDRLVVRAQPRVNGHLHRTFPMHRAVTQPKEHPMTEDRRALAGLLIQFGALAERRSRLLADETRIWAEASRLLTDA